MTSFAINQALCFRVCAVTLLIGLGACATSSDAKKAITKFAAATQTSTAAIKEYDEATSARATARVKQKGIAKPVTVAMLDDDCATTSKECKVVYESRQDDPDPRPLPIESTIPNHVAAADAIARYAAALQEVVDASAQEEVGAALDSAATAIASLAGTVNPASQPAAQAIAGPTGQLFAWAYGKYEDNLKLDALRAATQAMDKTMQEAAAKFGTVAWFAHVGALASGADEVENARVAFEENPSEGTLDALIESTKELNGALAAKTVFSDLAATHQKLTKALVEGPDSLVEVFAALDELGKDAEKLYSIAKAFKKAASTGTETGGSQ